MGPEQIWPQADSSVSLLTEDAIEMLVDDTCRFGLDGDKYLKTPGLFWELAWGCICIMRSNLKAGEDVANIMYFLSKKILGLF